MNNFYSNNDFDVNKFNQDFEAIQNKNLKEKENDEEKDDDEEVNYPKKTLNDMRLGSLFSNMKDEVFGTIYDMLSLNYKDSFTEIFTKNNRLFYIGIFLVLVCIVLYVISYLFFYPKPEDKKFNLNANIGLPDDYKFRYYPYKQQDAQEIIENRKTIESLKKKLVESKVKIKQLESKTKTTPKVEYEVDNEIINSDMMPPAVKNQIQTQMNNEMAEN